MRNIHTSILTLFLVTLFFGITKCSKKERIEGIPVQKIFLSLLLLWWAIKGYFNCKSFGSIHLRLGMPHGHIAPLSVLSAFQSTYIFSLIYLDKKIERFSCCGLLLYCQWCTTLSCQMQQPLRDHQAQLVSQDLEWKY